MTRRLQVAAMALLLELVPLAMTGRAHASPVVDPSSNAAATNTTTPAIEPDAQRAPTKRPVIPPLPPEYLVQEEGWIRLAYHPSMRERVRTLVAEAGAFRAKLGEELGADVLSSIEVRIAAGVPGELDRLAPSKPPSSEAAITFADLHLIVMGPPSPLALEPPRLADMLRHELALLALDQALTDPRPSQSPQPQPQPRPEQTAARVKVEPSAAPLPRVPRWFREGYAVNVAGDHAALRAQTLCMASLRGRLLSLADLSVDAPGSTPQASIAYAQAADFIRFLTQPSSKERFAALIASVRSGEPFERALATAYAESPDEIELAWRKDVARRYSFLPVFLGSTLVWVAAGVLVAVRRARRRRGDGDGDGDGDGEARRPILVRHSNPRRAELLEPARVRVVSIPASHAAIAASRVRAAKAEGAARGDARPPDADVPKVEHEGEWHTLH